MKLRVSSVGKGTVPHFAGRRNCMIVIINSSFLESERHIPEIQENKIRISGGGGGAMKRSSGRALLVMAFTPYLSICQLTSSFL